MRVAIVYATREGQTRRIAEYLAGAFQARDANVDLFDAAGEVEPDLDVYDAIVVAGSVHVGKHEKELVKLVKRHLRTLERIPSAFVSVSLSQAGVEAVTREPAQRKQAAQDVAGVLETFFQQTGWAPHWVQPVAGALLYTRYNFLIRFVIKQISKRAGGSTDTSRDHEYTNWASLERLATRMLDELPLPHSPLLSDVPARA
jgi:menaquinone-dependent protoporphyrinogen oxidase